MKIVARLSLVLSVLFLIVTANHGNAAMQSQQDNKSASVKHDYLPDYTVNTMDSEKPVLLAKRWGHYKRRHVCFDRSNKRGARKFTYRSKWCRTKRMKKAQRARKHYRRTVVAYHKRKQMVRKRPICRVGKRLLNEKGLKRKNRRCNIRPPWRSRHAGNSL